ncbi:MAG TPA: nuclear transport factor 2 family protein [Terriglobia bacterium]|nr:nuclear transport factor 2 family protein [Terriglobia bacterium]
MKRACLLLFVLLTAILPVRGEETEAAKQIRGLLDTQIAAWNRGDLDTFMQTYWKSPKTVFAGSSGVFHGWQAVLGRYKKTYPDRAAMGKTNFTSLEITQLAPDAAVVLGHWHLERANGRLGGVFTLVLRKFPEGWRIILDHTTAMNPPPSD